MARELGRIIFEQLKREGASKMARLLKFRTC